MLKMALQSTVWVWVGVFVCVQHVLSPALLLLLLLAILTIFL